MKKDDVDDRIYDLYDRYCHGRIDRRQFFERAAALTIGGVSALSMAKSLMPRYAEAQVISFNDERMKATYVDYPSPGGTSGEMRGYLVEPSGEGPFPAVLVMHENRGLNPYIEDVARRAAVEGFLALAPDGLSPIGGYPGHDDDGRAMQKTLDQVKLRQVRVIKLSIIHYDHLVAAEQLALRPQRRGEEGDLVVVSVRRRLTVHDEYADRRGHRSGEVTYVVDRQPIRIKVDPDG